MLTVSLPGFSDATVDGVVVSDGALELPPVVLQLASFGDTVVVTASRNEVRLIDAPVSTSVISTATLETTSAQNYGDLLRATPGVNVIQLSARDVQVTSRSPGNTLTNSQLVLVDGRSAYLDFFGLVLWDLLPTNFDDVEQIEVVRGPASAVWGANAMTGAVNIITKPPRESVGTTVTLSGGYVDRNDGSGTGRGAGSLFGANATVTRAPSDRLAYRISAGYFTSDAFARPTGRIPVIDDPRQPGQTVGGAFLPTGLGRRRLRDRIREPGHQPAEVRRTGRPGAVPWHPHIRGRRGRYGRAYPQRYRTVRHTVGNLSGLRQTDLHAGRPAGPVLHECPERPGAQPAAAGPCHREAAGAELQDADVRRRDRPLGIPRQPEPVELRRQRAPEQFRHHPRRRSARTGSRSAPICRTRSSGSGSAWFSAGAWTSSATCRIPSSHRASRSSSSRLRITPSRCRSTRPIARRRSSTTSCRRASSAGWISAASRRCCRHRCNRLSRSRSRSIVNAVGSDIPIGGMSQDELTEESLTAYEVSYAGVLSHGTTLGGSFFVNRRDDAINFTALPPSLDPYTATHPAARVAAPAGRADAAGAVREISAPHRVHLPESGSGPPDRRGAVARAAGLTGGGRVHQLLVAVRTGDSGRSEPASAGGAQPASDAPIQRRGDVERLAAPGFHVGERRHRRVSGAMSSRRRITATPTGTRP